jgi:hypothetical protein
MLSSKLRYVFASLLALGLLAGASLRAEDKPAKPADPAKPAAKPEKPAAAKTPVVQGTVKSVDAAKKSITMTVAAKKGQSEEKTIELDPDAKVLIDGKEAKLDALKPGYKVSVKLTADSSKAVGIGAEGPTLTGELKSVDESKHTLLIKVTIHDPKDKTKTSTEEKTLTLADNVAVQVPGQKKATLADLKPGANVNVRTSLEGEKVLSVAAVVKKGPTVAGEFKAVGEDKKSIKVAVTVLAIKGDKNSAKTEEKTIKLADDVAVSIDGKKQSKLEDIKPGTRVNVQMGVDSDKAVAVMAQTGEKKPEKAK